MIKAAGEKQSHRHISDLRGPHRTQPSAVFRIGAVHSINNDSCTASNVLIRSLIGDSDPPRRNFYVKPWPFLSFYERSRTGTEKLQPILHVTAPQELPTAAGQLRKGYRPLVSDGFADCVG